MSLAELRSAGVLELLDLEMAQALTRMGGSADPDVELAIALTSRHVRSGHTCFPLDTRIEDLQPAESIDRTRFPEGALWESALRRSVLTHQGPLVLDARRRLYFRRYWQLERDVAQSLARRASAPNLQVPDPRWLEPTLERLFGADGSAQRNAAMNALAHRVSLLCGGPGTGKTTAVAAIVALLVEHMLRETGATPKVLLLAPTGKSAARLAEAVTQAKQRIGGPGPVLDAIPEDARTIQSALGMLPAGMAFRRDADRPLEADILVVDETSMIDLALMRQLLEATPLNARLLMVGDPDQLTSVEAGSVLRDLVSASEETWWKGRTTHLTKTFRYAADQPLGKLIAAIRSGQADEVDALLSSSDAEDLTWMGPDALEAELDRAAERWSRMLEPTEPEAHFAARSRFVVLSPYRIGATGTRQLGAAIEDRLTRKHGRPPGIIPIIIEQNSQELQVYNGDFAMLLTTEPPMVRLRREPGSFPQIAEARLPAYSQAFALSVHKSQGSELDEVLVVFPDEAAPLLTRGLLYTAVSRARQRVRIVGPREVLLSALHRRAQRHSGLVDAIAQAAPGPGEVSGATPSE